MGSAPLVMLAAPCKADSKRTLDGSTNVGNRVPEGALPNPQRFPAEFRWTPPKQVPSWRPLFGRPTLETKRQRSAGMWCARAFGTFVQEPPARRSRDTSAQLGIRSSAAGGTPGGLLGRRVGAGRTLRWMSAYAKEFAEPSPKSSDNSRKPDRQMDASPRGERGGDRL